VVGLRLHGRRGLAGSWQGQLPSALAANSGAGAAIRVARSRSIVRRRGKGRGGRARALRPHCARAARFSTARHRRGVQFLAAQANPSGPLPVLTSPVAVIVFKSITATASREFKVV